MAIVVNVDWYFWSHRLPVARAVRDAGCEVVVVAGEEGGYGERIRGEGFRFVPLGISRRSLNPLRELATVADLARVYRRERPDLVHHVAVKAVLYGSLAASVAGVPAVINALAGQGWLATAGGMRGSAIRGIASLAYRAALSGDRRRVIFQNPDDRDAFIRRGLVRPERTVLIRGSGVNLERFRPTPEPGGTPMVVFASRLLWSKGVGDLVEAARALRARGVSLRLVLAGAPDPENREAIPAKQLEAWVAEGIAEWWGARNDIPSVLGQATVVALPSTYGEGVPMALLEAAASGRPIVTTDTPGCREVVRHGENGFVVPPRDPGALADALATLLGDADLRRRMGETGRDFAVAEFSEGDVVRRTLDVYRELLGSRWPPRANPL